MSFGFKRLWNGIWLQPQATTSPSIKGDLRYNSSTDKLELYNGSVDSIVTEAKAETLTNKTINGANNTLTVRAASDITGQILPVNGGTGQDFSSSSGAVSVASGTFSVGTLAVSKGGTGATTLQSNGVLFGNGTSAVSATSAGSQYQVYQAGAAGVPSVGALQLAQSAAVSGILPTTNGGTGQSSLNSTVFTTLFETVATTGGDLIYGGASGAPTRLANGTAGQVLTSNGTTTAPSWQGSAYPTAVLVETFGVTCTGTLNGSAFNTTIFGTIDNDTNSAYNTSTGIFTAPSAGYYLLYAAIAVDYVSISVGQAVNVGFKKNAGATVYYQAQATCFNTGVTYYKCSASGILKLAANDTIKIVTIATGTTPTYDNGSASASDFYITKIGT